MNSWCIMASCDLIYLYSLNQLFEPKRVTQSYGFPNDNTALLYVIV